MFKSKPPRKEECIMPIKRITFNITGQDNLPEDIRANKEADNDKARKENKVFTFRIDPDTWL